MMYWRLVSVITFLVLSADAYSSWSEEVIHKRTATSINIANGHYPNVVFDTNDKLHVTHDGQLYSEKDDSEWLTYELELGSFFSPKLPVSFKSDGSKHFFYSDGDAPRRNSKYVQLHDSGVSVIENFLPVTFESDVPPLSIIDSNDFLHLVYLDVNDWSINYATNESGSWVVQKIYTITYTEREKEIFEDRHIYDDLSYALDFNIDENNNITIAFVEWHYDPIVTNLIKLYESGGGWLSDIVSTSSYGDSWRNPTIKVDYDMNVHMVYGSIYCPDIFCYPTGIEYGSNKFGDWKEDKISTESYYFDDPAHEILDPYWVTGLVSDVSINRNNEIFISYVHGALDISVFATTPITSEIRTVKLDGCLPVSSLVYDDLLVGHAVHVLSEAGYIDGAINSHNLGAVAYHDKVSDEPHIFIEEKGLNVKSCIISENKINIEIRNLKGSTVQLDDVIATSGIDGVFSTTVNNCVNKTLEINEACSLEVDVSLSPTVDNLSNVDSTLYIGLQHLNEKTKESWFTVEAASLRPQSSTIDTSEEESASSGSGATNLLFSFIVFILLGRSRVIHMRHI